MSELTEGQEVYVKAKVVNPRPDEDGDIELFIRCADHMVSRSFFAHPDEIVTTPPTECEHFEVTGDKVTTEMEVFKYGGWSEVIGLNPPDRYFLLQLSERQISEYHRGSDLTYMARYKKKSATAEDALAKLGHDEEARKAILDGLRSSGFTVERVDVH